MNAIKNWTSRRVLSLFVALACGTGLAHAEWPEKPITILVPFSAGGAGDQLARMVATDLQTKWGQPVVVQNQPGAGGQIAMRAVARAHADGYTLGITSSGTMAINPYIYKDPGYDTLKDFEQVTILVDLPLLLVVNPAAPYQTLQQYLAAARSRPGTVAIGHSGIGTHQYLAIEQLAGLAGVRLNAIPYKGAAGMVSDLVGNSLESAMDNTVTQLPLIRAGKVRPLGISTARRAAFLPDVPTLAEAGLPGYESTAWFGLVAPAGTPVERVRKIQAAIAAHFAEPAVVRKLEEMGTTVAATSPQATRSRVQADLEAFGRIVKSIGLQPQ